MRDARQYGRPGFETLLRNHDIPDGSGLLKVISAVPVGTSNNIKKT